MVGRDDLGVEGSFHAVQWRIRVSRKKPYVTKLVIYVSFKCSNCKKRYSTNFSKKKKSKRKADEHSTAEEIKRIIKYI